MAKYCRCKNWKLFYEMHYAAVMFCGTAFRYCPFCGKEIKGTNQVEEEMVGIVNKILFEPLAREGKDMKKKLKFDASKLTRKDMELIDCALIYSYNQVGNKLQKEILLVKRKVEWLLAFGIWGE